MAIDFRIKDFAHPLKILQMHRLLGRTQWLSPVEVQAEQVRLLRRSLAHAYQSVPYYKRIFDESGLHPERVESVADLAVLPLLTRDIVREQGENLRAQGGHRSAIYSTSGTTGQPLNFRLDPPANSLEFVYYWRHWSWAGFRLGMPFAELGINYFLRRPKLLDTSVSWQPHLRRLMLNGAHISVPKVREMAQEMRTRRTRFIKGLASTLFFFASCLEEAGENDLELKAVFSTGEVLTPAFREKISRVFKCKVLDSYGHMERTVAISQCMEGEYHVHSDYGVLELVDQKPGPGDDEIVGRVVGTSLHNRVMPLIRYDVGDSITTYCKPRVCSCGRGLPLVKRIQGRTEDVIVTPDGSYITAIFILPELVQGVGLAQFEQKAHDHLEIRVVPDTRWNEHQSKSLQDYAQRLLGARMKVEIRTVTDRDIITDATGKRPIVISPIGRNTAYS